MYFNMKVLSEHKQNTWVGVCCFRLIHLNTSKDNYVLNSYVCMNLMKELPYCVTVVVYPAWYPVWNSSRYWECFKPGWLGNDSYPVVQSQLLASECLDTLKISIQSQSGMTGSYFCFPWVWLISFGSQLSQCPRAVSSTSCFVNSVQNKFLLFKKNFFFAYFIKSFLYSSNVWILFAQHIAWFIYIFPGWLMNVLKALGNNTVFPLVICSLPLKGHQLYECCPLLQSTAATQDIRKMTASKSSVCQTSQFYGVAYLCFSWSIGSRLYCEYCCYHVFMKEEVTARGRYEWVKNCFHKAIVLFFSCCKPRWAWPFGHGKVGSKSY